MKYSIKGIEKSKIIKSTQIINKKDSGKAIIVNYLDGTQDVFELNNENLNRIVEIAEEQGRKYVMKSKSRITEKRACLVASFIAHFVSVLVAVGFKNFSPLMLSIVIPSELLFFVSFFSLHKEKIYLKKYQLYFEKVKVKLEDYQEILEKEKQLVKSKNKKGVKLDNVLDLDKVWLNQIQKIDAKVDRYQDVEKVKTKTKGTKNIDINLQ